MMYYQKNMIKQSSTLDYHNNHNNPNNNPNNKRKRR